MSKEELKKEAIQYAVDYPTSYGKGYKHKDLRVAYLAGAEPREKRITELEKACNETQELLDKQIEATYKVVEENNELKDKLNNLSSVAAVRLANWQKYKKENAELKEKCETLEDMLDEGISYQKAKDYDGVVTSVLEQNHQLTKAISLINRLSEYIVLSEDYWKKEDVEKQKEILREAEQFLKED